VAERQEAGLLGGHVTTELKQGHDDNQYACCPVQQEVRDRGAGEGHVFEQIEINEAVRVAEFSSHEQESKYQADSQQAECRGTGPAKDRTLGCKYLERHHEHSEGNDSWQVELVA